MNDSGVQDLGQEDPAPKIPVAQDLVVRKSILKKFEKVGQVQDDVYYVDKIVGFKIVKDVMFFKCQWTNWPPSYNTWETYDHVEDCPDIIVDYFEKKPKRYEVYKQFCSKIETKLKQAEAELKRLNEEYEWEDISDGDGEDEDEDESEDDHEDAVDAVDAEDAEEGFLGEYVDGDNFSDDSGLGMSPREI